MNCNERSKRLLIQSGWRIDTVTQSPSLRRPRGPPQYPSSRPGTGGGRRESRGSLCHRSLPGLFRTGPQSLVHLSVGPVRRPISASSRSLLSTMEDRGRVVRCGGCYPSQPTESPGPGGSPFRVVPHWTNPRYF